MNRHMHVIEIATSLSSSLSSIGDDDCSLELSGDEQVDPPPQPDLEEEEEASLQMLTILASSSFEIEQLYQNSFDLTTKDVPFQITTTHHSPSRKRTISQHDETATTSNSTLFTACHRPRFYSEGATATTDRSLSPSQLSIRDVASMLGSLSILDSSEQLKSPAFHHRATCDRLPDADELSKLLVGDDAEKSHRRNTHVVLIQDVEV